VFTPAQAAELFSLKLDTPDCRITQYKLTKSNGTPLDASDLIRLDGSNYNDDGAIKINSDLTPA